MVLANDRSDEPISGHEQVREIEQPGTRRDQQGAAGTAHPDRQGNHDTDHHDVGKHRRTHVTFDMWAQPPGHNQRRQERSRRATSHHGTEMSASRKATA